MGMPHFEKGSRRGYVAVGEGQLHYRELGEGFPLVLLHQSPSSGAMWEPVLPGFAAAGYRAIAFDMPGFGGSTSFVQPPSIGDYAQAIFGALDGLEIDSFHAVGHHTGASVALEMAVSSSRLKKLALWGPCLFGPEKRARLTAEEPPVFDDEGESVKLLWQRRRALGGPLFTTDIALRFTTEVLLTGHHRPWGHWAAGHHDTEPLLRKLKQPVAFLSGQRDTQWEETKRAVEMVKGSTFVPIDGASMDVADEHPAEFVNAVVEFLQSKEG